MLDRTVEGLKNAIIGLIVDENAERVARWLAASRLPLARVVTEVLALGGNRLALTPRATEAGPDFFDQLRDYNNGRFDGRAAAAREAEEARRAPPVSRIRIDPHAPSSNARPVGH